MIDLVLVIIFCYQLYRLSRERGISPVPYLLNYLAAFTLMMIAFGFLLFSLYGPNILKSEEGIKMAMMFEPFAIMFEVFLFIYFRKRLLRVSIPSSGDTDNFNPPKSQGKEKKDLSYFR
jgi:hypothetical protein